MFGCIDGEEMISAASNDYAAKIILAPNLKHRKEKTQNLIQIHSCILLEKHTTKRKCITYYQGEIPRYGRISRRRRKNPCTVLTTKPKKL